MSPKRHGMYLSPEDDQQLLQELESCTVKGRKSELLRNYALLGYKLALDLCEKTQDHAALTTALAALFGAQESQHDFRQAAEFLKVRGLRKGQGGTTQIAAQPPAPVQAVVTAPAQPSEALREPSQPDDKAAPLMAHEAQPAATKPRWGALNSLVGGATQPKPITSDEKGSD
ncbi:MULTISPECIES: hypothetical protein [Pseudomonadota]|jgi:hypothetical protein|uniref:hypothetical protein n=1 Tax=Pseudomonadota TaxID=1224 RepID=UPI001185D995|nr:MULTISPECIES: hypothetical protein [Pseudomonadota]MDP3194416.1 hypothetical protein [Tabrizicola sp.]